MTYKDWNDKHVTGKTKKEYENIIGTTTNNGIKISGISEHVVDRAMERGVSAENAKNALINPLKIGKIKKGEKGNSQEYIGEFARTVVNPDTGNIVTVWKTKTSLKNKLKGVK